MTGRRTSSLLVVALVIMGTTVAFSPMVNRYTFGYQIASPWVFWAWTTAFLIPPIACVSIAIWQERQGRASRTFANAPLAVAAGLFSLSVLAIVAMGIFGVLLDLILAPLAAGFLALAWVYPRWRPYPGQRRARPIPRWNP